MNVEVSVMVWAMIQTDQYKYIQYTHRLGQRSKFDWESPKEAS